MFGAAYWGKRYFGERYFGVMPLQPAGNPIAFFDVAVAAAQIESAVLFSALPTAIAASGIAFEIEES